MSETVKIPLPNGLVEEWRASDYGHEWEWRTPGIRSEWTPDLLGVAHILRALAAAQAELETLRERVEAVERFAMTENGTVEFNGARWVAEFDRWGDERRQIAAAPTLEALGRALAGDGGDDGTV